MPAAAIEMMMVSGLIMTVAGFGMFMLVYRREDEETSVWEDVCAMVTLCGLVNIAVGAILWVVK